MLKRIAIYLKEMFPPASMLGTLLIALATELVYLRLYGIKPTRLRELIIPGVVMMFITLLVRVMDEFKDYQDDLRNFPDRPLPSGRVKHSDLKALGIFCVVMVIFLSSTSKPLLLWSLVSLGYTGLMLKWFFIEPVMRKSLPLAFVSHHPIVFFNFVYLLLSCMQLHPEVGWEKSIYIFPVCFIFTNWEIMRKIRSPEHETEYTTYSKIFGPRVAISVALVLQLIFITDVILIILQLNSPLWLFGAFVVLETVLILPTVKFLRNLKYKAPLKKTAEAQILSIIGTLLLMAVL